jgi:NADPH:quinone reductase-like Zn-dependent oxidoreductase
MKAWRATELGEPERVLTLVDVAEPAPGPGQLVVRTRAAAANFPDVLLCRGEYQIKPELPFTPGVELCGTVAAVGAQVTAFAVGDLVIDRSSADFVDAVRAYTDGRGADVIYDPVGGEVYERSTKCVAFAGR